MRDGEMKNINNFKFAICLILLGFFAIGGCSSDNSNTSTIDTRSIDGSDNNLNNPLMGATFTDLIRYVFPDYQDGMS
jgi:hypothetical protein